jgi:hypothetical protein
MCDLAKRVNGRRKASFREEELIKTWPRVSGRPRREWLKSALPAH